MAQQTTRVEDFASLLVVMHRQNEATRIEELELPCTWYRHILHHAQTTQTNSILVQKVAHTMREIALDQTRPPVISSSAWFSLVRSGLHSLHVSSNCNEPDQSSLLV